MTLSDIIFYKNLGIPLKQILEMKKTTPDEHRLLFQEKLIDLDRQRQELEQRGLTISPDQADCFSDEQKLWKNDHRKYISCLMREKVGGDYPNNLTELLTHVQKEHKTGYIISRFLLCAQEDGVLYDFYKTFIEILP